MVSLELPTILSVGKYGKHALTVILTMTDGVSYRNCPIMIEFGCH